jgi:predicted DNA-binding transcriptional regulator
MNLYHYLTNRIRFVRIRQLEQSMAMSRRILRDMEEAAAIYNLFRGLLT